MKPQSGSSFLNGVPELLVLGILREREMYGYELVQELRARTYAELDFAEGVIYPLLHGLERDGALTSRRQVVNGRSRLYYAVTEEGGARFARLSAHWQRLTRTIAGALGVPAHV
jgi:PadR family transcriptional regulator, regulatory protein PadR